MGVSDWGGGIGGGGLGGVIRGGRLCVCVIVCVSLGRMVRGVLAVCLQCDCGAIGGSNWRNLIGDLIGGSNWRMLDDDAR